MGQAITFEIGQLNIGRRIKAKGHAGGMLGSPGVLKAAERSGAIVQFDGAGHTIRVDWKHIVDWTSHNNGPLIMPALKANGTKNNGTVHAKLDPVVAPVPSSEDRSQRFEIYKDLGGNIQSALAEVRAAEDLLDEAMERVHDCKRAHEEATAKLSGIRKQAAEALKEVDEMLVGTQFATTPAIAK